VLLQTIAGRDPKDATSAFAPVPDYGAAMRQDVKGMKIGLPQEYFAGLENETREQVEKGIGLLRQLGCERSRSAWRTPRTPSRVTTSFVRRGELQPGAHMTACATPPVGGRENAGGDV